MFDFSNRVIIVTGATGSLGSVVAQAFRGGGAKLALVDRAAEDRFQQVFPEMAGSPDCAFAHSVDLTDVEAVAGMADRVAQQFGRIDGLINIAGGFRAGTPVHETPLDVWDFMLNINARTVFLASRAVVPHMLERGYGKIVSVAARPGLSAGRNNAAYAVSKSAVLRLTESLSAELKASNINVNCIIPGTIDTPQNRADMPTGDLGKWVKAEDLANVILFLASDLARAVHGAAVPVYGLT